MSAAMRARVLPWLLALPALLFATPLSPIDGDPYPHLAGIGWAALALVPLALAVLALGSRARGVRPFLLAAAWAVVSWRLAPVTDTFEARRALCGLAILPLAFAGGAALDEHGRRVLERLLVTLSLVWTAVAILWWEPFAGVLGDTGSLSQAALPGAAVAAVWVATGTGPRRVAGAAALLLFLVHVGAAPVIAGSHTLLAALLLGSWRFEGRGRAALLALAGAALIAPFLGLAVRQSTMELATFEGATEEGSRSLSGLGVRGMVWTSALGLVAEHPLVGAGPGQFQAAFPPHRDPREMELSRHGVCAELDTEVEHAHNDWLQGFVELGLVGGALLALGLALGARAAFRALSDPRLLACAVAALALLVTALVHAPLSSNAASAVLALALLGTVSGERAGGGARALGVLVALPVLVAAPFAVGLVRHGLALTRALRSMERVMEARGRAVGDPDEVRRALERPLAIAPDSVPALVLARGELDDDWAEVLTHRPHMAVAWEERGTHAARRGAYAEAHASYARALELAPTHPRLLRNAARLELTQGDPELGLELLARLRANGCADAAWRAELGSELVLVHGLLGLGARVLHAEAPSELVPEALHAAARTDAPDAEANGALAQLLWARQHAAAGDFALALRNYRQASERSHARRGTERGAAPIFALELAAAELRAGRADDARARAAGVRVDARTWSELTDWARAALGELGVSPEAP